MGSLRQESGTAAAVQRRYRRGMMALALLLAGLSVALLLLPSLVGSVIEHGLRRQGVNEVRIGHIGINPFTGELRLDDVSLGPAGDPDLYLDRVDALLAWGPVWQRRVRLVRLRLGEGQVSVVRENGALRVAGLVVPSGKGKTVATEPGWGIAADDLRLEGLTLNLRDGKFRQRVDLDSLRLQGLASWRPRQEAALKARVRLDGATLAVEGHMLPFAKRPVAKGRIRVDDLPLRNIVAYLVSGLSGGEPRGLKGFSATLGIDGNFEAGLAAPWRVSQQGRISLREVEISHARASMKQKSMIWQGNLHLVMADTPRLEAQGRLELDRGRLSLADRKLQGRHDAVRWRGRLSLDDAGAWRMHARLSARGVKLQGGGLPAPRTLELARAELKDLTLRDGNGISLEGVRVDGLRLSGGVADEVEDVPGLASLRVDRLTWREPGRLALGRVILAGLELGLWRDASGRLDWRAPAAGPAPRDRREAGAGPVALAIEELVLQGENRIAFEDRSVSPVFRMAFKPMAFSIEDLRLDDNRVHSPFTLQARVDDYTHVDMKGALCLACKPLDLSLTGRIEALDLASLSPYTLTSLGYGVTRGQLDADIETKVDQGVLEGRLKLALRRLQVEPGAGEQAGRMQERLGMPLDTALGMLRDEHGNIRLEVPVSGRLDDPEFSPRDAIDQALTKAMKTAAITYVSFALQPYGLLLTAARAVKEASGHVAMQPVPFIRGKSEVVEGSQDYLDKITTLLKQRPGLSLGIRGITVPGEERALGRQRAMLVKDGLIARGIEASRLFVSEPRVDEGQGASPRVELAL